MIKVIVKQRYPVPVEVQPQNGIQVKAYQAGPPGAQGPPGEGAVIGPNQVAFGAPVTGAITGNNNIQIFPDFGGNPARGYFQAYGARMGNINGGVIQIHTDVVTGWTNLELQPSGAGYIGFYTGAGHERARIDSTGVWKIYGGVVATDSAIRVDAVGIKFGPRSTMGTENEYPFQIIGPNGSSAFRLVNGANNSMMFENYTYGSNISFSFTDSGTKSYLQTNNQVFAWTGWLSFSSITHQAVYDGGWTSDINYSARRHNFAGKIQMYTSADFEIEFVNPDNSHNANIFYSTPNRNMSLAVHSGYVEFSTDNYASYILSLAPASVIIRKGVLLAASTAALATLNVPSGIAPTTPVSGDIWYNGSNLKFRNGSTTRNINTDEYVVNEIPSGLINGSNATFTTAFDFVPGTEEVFLNGLKLVKLEDYNTTGNNQIDLYVSPLTGEDLIVNYSKI